MGVATLEAFDDAQGEDMPLNLKSTAGEINALHQLQAKLLAGEASRRQKPRSAHTVRGYMNSVLAALNWADLQGWLPSSPRLRN